MTGMQESCDKDVVIYEEGIDMYLNLIQYLLLLAYVLLIVFCPNIARFSASFKQLPSFIILQSHFPSWKSNLPLQAASRKEAWNFGVLEGRILSIFVYADKPEDAVIAAATVVPGLITSTLGLAGNLIGSKLPPPPSHSDRTAEAAYLAAALAAMRSARGVTAELERGRGFVASMTGAFSLINIVLAILGIVTTLFPVFFMVIGPTIAGMLLHAFFAAYRLACGLWWAAGVHAWRPLLYLLCAGTFRDAADPARDHQARVHFALLLALLAHIAAASALPAYLAPAPAACVCGVLLYAPLAHAVAGGSSLLGFLAVACAYCVLSFGAAAVPFGYVVGFDSRSALDNSAAASLVLVLLAAAARAAADRAAMSAALRPYAAGVQTLGATVGYLALLIRAGASVFRDERWPTAEQAAMTAALVAGTAVGALAPLPGLLNTALVFAVLFAMDLVAAGAERAGGEEAAVLAVNAGVLWAAGALRRRPYLIVSLFDLSVICFETPACGGE